MWSRFATPPLEITWHRVLSRIFSKAVDQVLEKNGAIHRSGPDHYPLDPGFYKSGGSFLRANPAPYLHRDIQRADQPFNHLDIPRLTGKSGVQVYDVQAVSAFLFPASGECQRVVRIHSLIFELPFAQTHHLPVQQVDRW